MSFIDGPSNDSRHRRRRRYLRAIRAHDLAAERLLLVGAFHHIDLAIEPEERTRHRKRCAPLSRTGLGSDALQALRLCVVRLGDCADDGSQLRPFIVWFGEEVPNIEVAADYVMEADVLVIIGTSLNVYPAAGLVRYAKRGAEIYLIDPAEVNVPYGLPVHVIRKGASEGMRELIELLNTD